MEDGKKVQFHVECGFFNSCLYEHSYIVIKLMIKSVELEFYSFELSPIRIISANTPFQTFSIFLFNFPRLLPKILLQNKGVVIVIKNGFCFKNSYLLHVHTTEKMAMNDSRMIQSQQSGSYIIQYITRTRKDTTKYFHIF